MKKFSIYLLPLVVALSLSACGVSKEAKTARTAGIEYLNQKDFSMALDSFETALYEAEAKKIGDFHLDVLKYRAEAEYGLGDYEAAVHTYSTLIEGDKERPEYLYQRAIAKAALGQWQDSLADYEKGAAQDGKAPFRMGALIAITEACQDAGEYEKAIQLFKGLEQDGEVSADLYQRMGLCYLAQKNYESALASFQAGIALGEEAFAQELSISQAVTYEYMGEFSKALELFEAHGQKYGTSPEVEKEIAFLKTR